MECILCLDIAPDTQPNSLCDRCHFCSKCILDLGETSLMCSCNSPIVPFKIGSVPDNEIITLINKVRSLKVDSNCYRDVAKIYLVDKKHLRKDLEIVITDLNFVDNQLERISNSYHYVPSNSWCLTYKSTVDGINEILKVIHSTLLKI
jgi:hypothetical protein